LINFGFSTGSLFHQKCNVSKSIDILCNYNLKCIELSFANLWELDEFSIDNQIEKKLLKFENITIHAPFIKYIYNNDDKTKKVLDKIDSFCKIINIKSVVFHPDVINDFNVLNNYSFIKSIENMDIKKVKGIKIDEFLKYNDLDNINFIFDVQHAYEHDNLKKYSDAFKNS